MHKLNILVVDDEKDVRDNIINFLKKRFDHNYIEAENGIEAIKCIKDNLIDVLILDIKMPKKSGIAVMEEVKRVSPKTAVLVITGWISDDVVDEAIKKGATDYVIKPIEMEALLLKFKSIVEKMVDKEG